MNFLVILGFLYKNREPPPVVQRQENQAHSFDNPVYGNNNINDTNNINDIEIFWLWKIIGWVSKNNINVTTVPTSSNMPMSVEGRAALLMFAPPSNPNNPYLLNSFIQYNVLPVT